MSQSTSKVSPFIHIETIHQGEVSWWWRAEALHDTDYHVKVWDSVDKKVSEIVAKLDVMDNQQYRTQWDGRMFIGTDIQQVTAAANELARHMAKFKGVASLQELSGN